MKDDNSSANYGTLRDNKNQITLYGLRRIIKIISKKLISDSALGGKWSDGFLLKNPYPAPLHIWSDVVASSKVIE